MRVCSQPGCPTLITKPGRCPTHTRAADRARGSRQARGYGTEHTALRAEWAPRVATGTIECARCDQPIAATEAWDLGHNDRDRTQYAGPEHRACNRATSGR